MIWSHRYDLSGFQKDLAASFDLMSKEVEKGLVRKYWDCAWGKRLADLVAKWTVEEAFSQGLALGGLRNAHAAGLEVARCRGNESEFSLSPLAAASCRFVALSANMCGGRTKGYGGASSYEQKRERTLRTLLSEFRYYP